MENKKTLKEKVKTLFKREFTWALIWASPLILPNAMDFMVTRGLLEAGFGREVIEKEYREELPKEYPYMGKVREILSKPGRELAYATTKQYKFPWRGYPRQVYR